MKRVVDDLGAGMGVLLKPKSGGRPVVIDKPIILIGRHPDCDLVIKESPKISRKHCCLALVDNRFVVRDLDSMNGVWVNGDRVVHSSDVCPGDELTIGDVPFELVNNGASPRTPRQERPAEKRPPEPETDGPSRHTGDDEEEGATADDPGKALQFNADGPLPFSGEMDSGEDYVIPIADIGE